MGNLQDANSEVELNPKTGNPHPEPDPIETVDNNDAAYKRRLMPAYRALVAACQPGAENILTAELESSLAGNIKTIVNEIHSGNVQSADPGSNPLLALIDIRYNIFKTAVFRKTQYPENTIIGIILRNTALSNLIAKRSDKFTMQHPFAGSIEIISNTDELDRMFSESSDNNHSGMQKPESVIPDGLILTSIRFSVDTIGDLYESRTFSKGGNGCYKTDSAIKNWLQVNLRSTFLSIKKEIQAMGASTSRSTKKESLENLFNFLASHVTDESYLERKVSQAPSTMMADWLDSPAYPNSSGLANQPPSPQITNLEVLSENRRMVKRDIPKTLEFVLGMMDADMKTFYECKAKMLTKIDEAAVTASTTDKKDTWKAAAEMIRATKFDYGISTEENLNALKSKFTAFTAKNDTTLSKHTRNGINIGSTFSSKQTKKVEKIVTAALLSAQKASTANKM